MPEISRFLGISIYMYYREHAPPHFHWSKAVIPHVVEAKYLEGRRVWLRFDDGSRGEVGLADELGGPVFEPLKDVELFSQFLVRYNTLSWQNGADFAPELLRGKLAQNIQEDRAAACVEHAPRP